MSSVVAGKCDLPTGWCQICRRQSGAFTFAAGMSEGLLALLVRSQGTQKHTLEWNVNWVKAAVKEPA